MFTRKNLSGVMLRILKNGCEVSGRSLCQVSVGYLCKVCVQALWAVRSLCVRSLDEISL